MVVMTAMWGMGGVVAPSVAKAASAGDLIRTESSSAVYYLGSDNKKHTFTSDKLFFTWYKDFSSVKVISQSEMLSYDLGANVVMRPGTKLVQFVEIKGDGTFNVADPKVYAVSTSGAISHIDSAATAVAMFGANWEKNIVAIPNYLFTNYTVAGQLTASSKHLTGSLIKTADSSTIYYVDGSTIRPISSSAFDANGFNSMYVLTVSSISAYTQGTSITAKEDMIANPQFGAAVVVPGSGVTVSSNSSTPASQTIAKGASSVELLKFNLTAANDGAANVSQIKIKRSGVGARGDWTGLYLYDGSVRLGYGKSINSDETAIFNNLNLTIAAGSTKTLSLRGDMLSTATAGNQHVFSIESGAITAGGAVNGTFPISSNQMNVGGASAGSLTIEKSGSLSNPAVGDLGVKVAEFRLAAGSTEDVKLNRIALYQNGTISNANLSNFKLYEGSTLVASASSISNNLLTFDLTSNVYNLAKSQSRSFSVRADISASAKPAETIKFYVEEKTDVYGVGASFGYGASVTITSYNGTADKFSLVTLQGGQVTVSRLGPAASTLAGNMDNQNWLEFTVTAAVNMEIKNWRLEIHNDTINLDMSDPRIIAASTTPLLTNIKIMATDGSFSTDSKDITSFANVNGNDNGVYTTYTDSFNMSAGTTKTFKVLVDSETGLGTSGSYYAVLGSTNSSDTYTFDDNSIKNSSNNQFITDIVPSTYVAGNKMTYADASLTLSLGNYKGTQTKVIGASNVDLLQYNFKAGSGSDMTVEQVKFNAYIASTTPLGGVLKKEMDGFTNNYTYAKDVVGTTRLYRKDGSNWVQIGTAKSINNGEITFDNLNWKIAKGVTETIVLRGDLNTTAVGPSSVEGPRVAFDIFEDGVTVKDESNNDKSSSVTTERRNLGTETNLTYTGENVMIKVSRGGSLYVADNSSPESSLVVAGTADAPVLKLKFNASDEGYNVKKFRISQAQNTTNSRSVDSIKVSYKNKDGVAKTASLSLSGSDANFDFGSDPSNYIWVPANGIAEVDVYASFKQISGTSGAYSGDQVKFVFSKNLDFEAVGESSNTIYTTNVDVTGNLMTIYKAFPIFSKVALNESTFTNGASNTIYKFKVTASQGSSIKLKKVALKVNLTGPAVGSSLALDQIAVMEDNTDLTPGDSGTNAYRVYNGADTATASTGRLDTDTTGILSSTSGTQDVLIVFNDARTISASASKTYTISATLSGASTTQTTYSVNTYLAGTDSATAGVSYLTNRSSVVGATGANSVYGLEDYDGANDKGAYYIWSDTSGTAGNGNNTDINTVTESAAHASSSDWFNGYGLKSVGSTNNSTVSRTNP